MTDDDLAKLDPGIQALAMLTGLSFTVEMQLALTLSHVPAEYAHATADATLKEWRARAAPATVAAGGQTQIFPAATLCIERLVGSAVERADDIRNARAGNAAAAAMATMPPSGAVN